MGVRQLPSLQNHHSISKPIYSGLNKTEIVIWPRNAIGLYWCFFFNSASKPNLLRTSIFPTWLALRGKSPGIALASPLELLRRWPFKDCLRLLSSFCECCRNEADTGTCRYVLHWIRGRGAGDSRYVPQVVRWPDPAHLGEEVEILRKGSIWLLGNASTELERSKALEAWRAGWFQPQTFSGGGDWLFSRGGSWNQVRLALSLSGFFSAVY